MPKTPVSFKLDDVERNMLDSIAAEIGGGRPDALRYALMTARRDLDLYAKDAEAFIASLRASMADDATILVQLDDTWTPVVTVDGERRGDIYVPTLAMSFGPGEDFLKIYLADSNSDVRIFVGVLPVRSGVPLVIPAKDLHPDMPPRAVAYTVSG